MLNSRKSFKCNVKKNEEIKCNVLFDNYVKNRADVDKSNNMLK